MLGVQPRGQCEHFGNIASGSWEGVGNGLRTEALGFLAPGMKVHTQDLASCMGQAGPAVGFGPGSIHEPDCETQCQQTGFSAAPSLRGWGVGRDGVHLTETPGRGSVCHIDESFFCGSQSQLVLGGGWYLK